MERVAQTDETLEERLNRLMLNYGDALTGLCTSILGDAYLAQDIVQEAFLRVYPRLERIAPGKEKAYLTKVTINLCHDQMRGRWFRFVNRKVSLEDLPEPAAPLEVRDNDVFAAVQALPQKEREVVLLFYYQDMTADEIAGALSMSRSGVYRRLQCAQKRLKETIERWEDHEG